MAYRTLNIQNPEKVPGFVGRAGTVVSDPIVAVAQFAMEIGISCDRVKNIIGAPHTGLTPGVTLPAAIGPDLFKLILEEGGGDAPALQISQLAPFSFFGGLERAVLLAPSGREALRTLATYFSVFHDRLEATFDETSNFSYFSFRFPGAEIDNGCCNEVVIGVLIRLMRSVFGNYAKPEEVRLRYDRNGNQSTYKNFFSGKLSHRSSDGRHGLVFRRADMDWRQPRYDSKVFELSNSRLEILANKRRKTSSKEDFLELINASNVGALMGIFSVSAVAERVGFSERKAQRVARINGTTIANLIEQSRLRLLREEIARNPRARTDELCGLVGLSDSRALRRALKSWTGKSIQEFRRTPFEPLHQQ